MKSLYARTRYRRNARLRARTWSDRVAAYLQSACDRECDPHLRTDICQALSVVSLAARNVPQAFVTASYNVFGCHPDKVALRVIERRKSKLGDEYSLWYDRAGALIPERWDIPDYDPTSGMIPGLPRKQAMPEPVLPRSTSPKSPLRLVVSRREGTDARGRVSYVEEQLECGHSQTEYLGGANLSSRRRRCQKCKETHGRMLPQISPQNSSDSPSRVKDGRKGKELAGSGREGITPHNH